MGKLIVEAIIVAHEAIHLARKAIMASMILKLDILKAYDLVDRQFLVEVLERFGLNWRWINWVKSCISTPTFLVLVNGASHGFFAASRGLRQGDPLSPFLFIIIAEALRSINQLKENGRWKGMTITMGLDPITHQQFADDTILFVTACRTKARVIGSFLDSYCKASGQRINWRKSEVFFHNTQPSLQRDIAKLLDPRVANFPGRFLGMLLFAAINKKSYWENLINCYKNKMETWKGKWITSTCRILMLKSILSAILI